MPCILRLLVTAERPQNDMTIFVLADCGFSVFLGLEPLMFLGFRVNFLVIGRAV